MTTPVDLIIPDAGPIISLAHADRLDLLGVFRRPVRILDVVKIDCLRKPGSPDYEVLRRWFDTASNMIAIIESPFRAMFEAALDDERSGRDRRAARGFGDAAIAWALKNLDRFAVLGAIPLVLVEDSNFAARLAGENVHILATRSWLYGLEDAGEIASADEVIGDIGRHGRGLSSLEIDRPVRRDGGVSDWIAALGERS